MPHGRLTGLCRVFWLVGPFCTFGSSGNPCMTTAGAVLAACLSLVSPVTKVGDIGTHGDRTPHSAALCVGQRCGDLEDQRPLRLG